MAHYKCGACRTRLQVSGQPADLVGELCPECGSLLEPVVELVELIGFRRIRSQRRVDDGGFSDAAAVALPAPPTCR